MTDRHLLVLQHLDCEPAGAYAAPLARHLPVRTVLTERDPLPGLDGVAGLVVLGGPAGAGDPALAGELDLVSRALAAHVPIWGVCLGAQLLAAAAGGRVRTGPSPEIGVDEVALSDAGRGDPVFGALPARLGALHFHGDTFDLPPGAVHLAGSAAYANQAFRVGSSYGVQFHLEVDGPLVAGWLRTAAYRDAATAVLGPDAPAILERQLARAGATMARQAVTLVERWLGSLG